MQGNEVTPTLVKVKAVLVDPRSMTVLWVNESAEQGAAVMGATPPQQLSFVQAVPMAEQMGVLEALNHVAQTGEPQHLKTDVVSTFRGSMMLVTSLYRLPDGNVLVLTENAWQSGKEKTAGDASRRAGRRSR